MNSSIIKIEEGRIQGTRRTDLDGNPFHAFLGIPYAKPPLGQLRFKASEPIEPWKDVKDATKEGNTCYHQDFITKKVIGSENCLNLHVYTKTVPSEETKSKPVMVWFYGGGFRQGSNLIDTYGPDYLLTEDIVLVVPNYRLGFFGFLSFDDTSLGIYGNAGIKDQRLVLKWVQRNIKHFNGDPNNVTIFGESAGSLSVHYHILSPSSKGLFHKAIMQSGSVLNPWTRAGDFGLKFAKSIKPDVETEAEALEVLQKLSTERLFKYQEKFSELKGGEKIFGAIVEKPNPTAVLTKEPAELLASGEYNKVPLIIGYCDREGLLMQVYANARKAAGLPAWKRHQLDLKHFVHPCMKLDKNDPIREIIIKKLSDLYFQPPLVDDKSLLHTDYEFVAGIIGAAKLHSKTNSHPVYLYRMSLDAGLNILKRLSNITGKGACHADDIGYLFYVNAPLLHRGDVEMTAIKRFVKLWTNFAKTANPTPANNSLNTVWKPIDENDANFLDIGTILTVHKNPESERMDVWKEIFQLSPKTVHYL